jgi:hypothetical protein
MADPRWDGDERGEGVADASTFAAGAFELVEAMGRPRWVSEDPEVHLLPHVEQACRTLPFEEVDARPSVDGSFDLRLRWTDEAWRVGQVRAAVFALVGSFAESATYVRQRRIMATENGGETLLFEIVTGILDDGTFAPHGHTVRITVTPWAQDRTLR